MGSDQPQAPACKGKVQLIDATSFWVRMRKSLGDKRREIPPNRAQDILQILADFRDGDTRRIKKEGREDEILVSRIFPTTHFGFRKITFEHPLRLSFQAPERIARLEEQKGFQSLAQSKKNGAAGAKEQAEGRKLQEAEFLDVETARIDALIARVRDAIDRLNGTPHRFISAAVTGKLEVREAPSP